MNIEAGGFYFGNNELYIREILDIFGPDVTYREHAFRGIGVPYSQRKCVRGTFKRWATRSCTAEEIASLIENGVDQKRTRPTDAPRNVGRIEIRAGDVYTNHVEWIAREVVGIKGRKVTQREFYLKDGQPRTAPSTCDIKSFRDWVTRLCTTEEAVRLDRNTPAPDAVSLGELASQVIGLALAEVSDIQLLTEMSRRGFQV